MVHTATRRVNVIVQHLGQAPAPVASAPNAFAGWTSDPTQRLPRYSGDGSADGIVAETLMARFRKRVEAHGDRVCLRTKRTHDQPEWTTWTYNTYHEEVMAAASSLVALGFKKSDIVNILSFNSPEWFFAALGAISAGGLTAGIYNTSSPPAIEYIVNHSKAKFMFLDTQEQLNKVKAIKDRCPSLKYVVLLPFPWTGPVKADAPWILTWDQFLQRGREVVGPRPEVEARIKSAHPATACYLSYTSGTTGQPKAVMYSHDNIVFGISQIDRGLQDRFQKNAPELGYGGLDETTISYMPLSHIAGSLDFFRPCTLPLDMNVVVNFGFPDAMQGSLGKTLSDVRPTIFLAVPRAWEKLELGAQGLLKQGMDKVQVRAALGLDKVKLSLCGAAPVSDTTMAFFGDLGIDIMEIYGMTENVAVATLNYPGKRKVGSIGIATVTPDSAGNHQVSLAPGTGEICTRSRATMMGYMYNEEKTRDAIDADGWLHTGDVGAQDADGFFKITGRIKEMIITAGGENMAPVLIEAICKEEMPAISNIMMVGDRQKYLIALVALKTNPDPAAPKGFSENLMLEAAAVDGSVKTVSEAIKSPAFEKYLAEGFARANKQITSRAQNVRKWVLLPRDFSPMGEDAELTPTLKLRRDWAHVNFAEQIKGCYGSDYMPMQIFGKPL